MLERLARERGWVGRLEGFKGADVYYGGDN